MCTPVAHSFMTPSDKKLISPARAYMYRGFTALLNGETHTFCTVFSPSKGFHPICSIQEPLARTVLIFDKIYSQTHACTSRLKTPLVLILDA